MAGRCKDAERLTAFGDRDRIARDRHDQVIQRLYAIFALQSRGKAAPSQREKVMEVIGQMTWPMGMSFSGWLDTGPDNKVPDEVPLPASDPG